MKNNDLIQREFRSLDWIAQKLAQELPNNRARERSYIEKSMTVALAKALAAGWDLAWFEPGTYSYEAAKNLALSGPVTADSEFSDVLFKTIVSEADKPRLCSQAWSIVDPRFRTTR